MEKTNVVYKAFCAILHEELIVAMGCTEPIALAYAAAIARETLGALPDKVEVEASGSIIKNVKSVIVPHTGGLRGIPAATVAGIIGGNASKKLEVIADVSPEKIVEMHEYLAKTPIVVKPATSGIVFDIVVTMRKGVDWAKVRIADSHTNVVLVEKNSKKILSLPVSQNSSGSAGMTDRTILNIRDIVDFAESCDISDVREPIKRQIECNSAISEEGLKGNYGACVGKTLREFGVDCIEMRAAAAAAAGSDARMNGCEMPVVTNSGSGNQGMTVSLPVIEYAKEMKVGEEKLYRALVLANLVAIHQKTGIGRLSAYCGAVNAATGAAAAIAWLAGGDLDMICNTVTNSLGTTSGMICDGAKASCASKIATAVQMGILAWKMAAAGRVLQPGDGIVGDGIESTIRNVGRLGRDGMFQTNTEIIAMMTE